MHVHYQSYPTRAITPKPELGRAAWALRDARALRAGVADPDFALDERRERRVDDALVGVLTVTIA